MTRGKSFSSCARSYYIGMGLEKLRNMNGKYSQWGNDITRLDLYPQLTVQDIEIVTRFVKNRNIINLNESVRKSKRALRS